MNLHCIIYLCIYKFASNQKILYTNTISSFIYFYLFWTQCWVFIAVLAFVVQCEWRALSSCGVGFSLYSSCGSWPQVGRLNGWCVVLDLVYPGLWIFTQGWTVSHCMGRWSLTTGPPGILKFEISLIRWIVNSWLSYKFYFSETIMNGKKSEGGWFFSFLAGSFSVYRVGE